MPIPEHFGMITSAREAMMREIDRQREYLQMEMQRQRQYMEYELRGLYPHQSQASQAQQAMPQHSHAINPQHEISVKRYQDPHSFREYEVRYNHRTGEKNIKEIAKIEMFEHGEGRNEMIKPVQNDQFFFEDNKKHKNRRKLFWARWKQNNQIKRLVMA